MNITLELPEEFVSMCEADGIEPVRVLRGFIADLAEIHNWANNPREDGYSSNGSDERRIANEYYVRVGYPYEKEYRRSPSRYITPNKKD